VAAQHRAMYLLDIPRQEASRHTVTSLTTWMNRQSRLHHPNVVLYVPRVHVSQTPQLSSLQAIPASGTMAGVFARTDHHQGVWESPAGTKAILQGVQGLEQTLTQLEIGQLNGMGINPIRPISPSHFVAWGARTLSSDPEWKYVSVRRTALFIKSSIRKSLAWIASETNDEPLWAHIRQSLIAFMQTLFQKGAFQGQKPQEAYFIKCGRETISASDQRTGIIHMTIGFAPLKPAEFTILKLQQQARSSRSA
jgi:phage tail sheath protein FI